VARSLVLTLDVGTSSTRAMLYDERADALAESEVKIEYRPQVDGDGKAELDPVRLLRCCLDAITGTVGALHPGDQVAAVGISSFWHGLLGLDRAHRPSTPLILWSDTRSWREARDLAEEVDAEAVRLRTGAPLHPSYWPPRLAWLRKARPVEWQRTQLWVSFADYLYCQLFGRLGTSASMASAGMVSMRLPIRRATF